MGLFLIVLLLAWNFGISWLNCWYVGKMWAESKVIGGWFRAVTWAAAVQGSFGFIWCNLLVVGFLFSDHVGLLPAKYILHDKQLELLWNIGYVIVIFPLLGSGLMIWLDSVKRAIKTKRGWDIGVAAYNTFAMAHNSYEAVKFLPTVLEKIGKSLKDSNNKAALGTIYLALAISIGGGLGLAYYIIHSTASKVALNAKIASLEAQVANGRQN